MSDFWKGICRKQHDALKQRMQSEERLKGALFDSQEEVRNLRAMCDGFEWMVSELKIENESLMRENSRLSDIIDEMLGET